MSTEPVAEYLHARARDVLRAAPEPGWDAIAETVVDRVRATPRNGWPIAVASDDNVPGQLAVSDLVVRGAIARALRRRRDVAVTDATLTVEAGVLTAVRIDLAAQFGVRLADVAPAVRDAVAAVIADVLGPAQAPVPIDVVFVDVLSPVSGHL